ncbi:MAG: peptidylprolyl isomerase, partial [Bacteroidota bacterium]
HSADPGSAPNGGALPWFGTGRMVAEFEEAAFALENDGDISKPFRTQYGWHIVKRLERKGLGTFEDAKFELKRRVERDIRGNQSRTSLIRNIKRDYQFTEDREAKQRFYTVLTEDYFRGGWKAAEAAKGLDKMLFRLNDETYNPREVVYTQQDFANFLERTQRRQPIVDVRGVVDTKYQQFMEESCIAFENDNLEYKYPEFRALMREYRDGILLFELMDEKVWSKAVKDSAGLEQFHQAHQQDFMWQDRVDAHIYTCANEAVASKVRKLVKKRASKGYTNKDILDKINVESQLNLKIESGKFQQGDNATVDQVARKKGLSDNIPVNGQVVLVQINALLPATPKALAEARGMVTASYQTYLEEQWIEELRKTYPVSVDRSVLSTIK